MTMGYDRISQIPSGATVTNIEPITGYESENETGASTICSVVYEHREKEYRTSVVGRTIEEIRGRLTEEAETTACGAESVDLEETNDLLQGTASS